MQNPILWLRTATDLAEVSSAYFANCSKCQWLWPVWPSKPIVPALTLPMTLPPLQKYWYAFMTGVACDRNPSTSSGPWPPTHTVAPKSRKS
jgi:hypothetical protein